MTYDDSNVFAKILRGEVPCRKIYEDDHALAFHDIAPQAPVHALVVPKGQYASMADFSAKASEAEQAGLVRAIGKVAEALDLVADGYRVLTNHGRRSHQDVPHLHFHIFGGRALGPMLEGGLPPLVGGD